MKINQLKKINRYLRDSRKSNKIILILLFTIFTITFVYAQEAVTHKFQWKDFKVTFDPSPDTRVTGYNIYWLNVATNIEKKRDIGTATITEFVKEEFTPDVVYKLTATAYGLINNEPAESVRSDPYFVMFYTPLQKPGAPSLLELIVSKLSSIME
jgi:hypothetical protein